MPGILLSGLPDLLLSVLPIAKASVKRTAVDEAVPEDGSGGASWKIPESG